MTEHELRVCYEIVYRMITRERKKREEVLAGKPYLKQKLDECDNAIIALTTMKDELKRHVVEPIQEMLIDVPETARKGGY